MNIRVDLNISIKDGTEVVFRSPVDCSQITGLIVYYIGDDGNASCKEFAFADSHGNNVGDIDHLFAENVAVKVILDVTSGMAFVQNADTNAYLEGRFEDLEGKIAGVGSDYKPPAWGSKVDGEEKQYEIALRYDSTKTAFSSHLVAEVTQDTYDAMMNSEDFVARFDDDYSGIYYLAKEDFSYATGLLSFKTDQAQNRKAKVDISFSNKDYSKIPLAYLETPEQSIPHLTGTEKNPIILRDLLVGSYIVDGKVKTFKNASGLITWWKQFIIVSPVPAQNATYVQAFYPASHAIHRYSITDTGATVDKVYLENTTVQRLHGESDNGTTIFLSELEPGAYILDGRVCFHPSCEWENVLWWRETLVTISRSTVEGVKITTSVMAMFPASHGIHQYVITEEEQGTVSVTNQTAYLDDLADVQGLKENSKAITYLSNDGTAESDFVLHTLEPGVYVLNGRIRTWSGSAQFRWSNAFTNIARSGGKTYAQVMFPASHSLHLYTITDDGHELTKTSFKTMLDDIAGMKTKTDDIDNLKSRIDGMGSDDMAFKVTYVKERDLMEESMNPAAISFGKIEDGLDSKEITIDGRTINFIKYTDTAPDISAYKNGVLVCELDDIAAFWHSKREAKQRSGYYRISTDSSIVLIVTDTNNDLGLSTGIWATSYYGMKRISPWKSDDWMVWSWCIYCGKEFACKLSDNIQYACPDCEAENE